MRDLGSLGGYSEATAVSGRVVVGDAEKPAGSFRTHGFVFDLAAGTLGMVDLGTLGGRQSHAAAVSGSVIAGWARTSAGQQHAVVWRRVTS
jgi:uncharacterized membrane protein